MLGGAGLLGCDDGGDTDRLRHDPRRSAHDCPIDTVVVLMMENRSFDHYLGWLGTDEPTSRRGAGATASGSGSTGASTSRTRTPRANRSTTYPLVGARATSQPVARL